MPAKLLVINRSASKQLLKLPLIIHQRVITALKQIKANPVAGAKLHGEMAAYYKFRIGDYRIVYKFYSKESRVDVVKIEHRQGVYR